MVGTTTSGAVAQLRVRVQLKGSSWCFLMAANFPVWVGLAVCALSFGTVSCSRVVL